MRKQNKKNIEEDGRNYIDKVLEEYEESEKASKASEQTEQEYPIVDETKSELFSNEDIVTSEDVPKLTKERPNEVPV